MLLSRSASFSVTSHKHIDRRAPEALPLLLPPPIYIYILTWRLQQGSGCTNNSCWSKLHNQNVVFLITRMLFFSSPECCFSHCCCPVSELPAASNLPSNPDKPVLFH
jgi:hypothetical protein